MNEQEVLARVRAAGLLSEGREVVVLLSGGRDSTCLLDLSARIAGPDAVRALHVNFGLRGPASDDDERHCAALCARLGVALTVRRPGPARARGNLQAWAREVRYREAGELAGPRGADVAHTADLADAADVAAGHTATDQVETILYRLASSPSRRALLGMRPREALAGGGRLVRPLLGITRADTAAYCESRGLTWREDESNASDAYARNRVRSGLLAALSEVHPGALGNVLAVAEVLRDEAEVLDALVDDAVGDGEAVTLEALRGLPAALRRLVVQRMADEASGGLAPGAARRADDVAAMAERGTTMLDIGGGLRAVAEYGRVHIERLDARGAVAQAQVVLAIPGCASFGGIEVRCEVTAPVPEPGVLDRGALGRSELVVRTWRAGDRIAPLGLGGATKSLQDLFTGRRVPRLKRSTVPVVECGGEIVWVAGVATSERFKVTASTREAVRLSCS